MTHRRVAVILLAASMSLASAAPPPDVMPDELEYEPAEVLLSGRLMQRVFPGPPNYESVAKGDEAEHAFILKLDHPVRVRQSTRDPDLNSEARDVRAIHVGSMLDDEGDELAVARLMKSLVGRDVVIKAGLMRGHTGHHHADVVGFVKQIKPKGAAAFPALTPRTSKEKDADDARAAQRKEAELRAAGIARADRPLPIETGFKRGKRVRLEGQLTKRKVPADSPNETWAKDGQRTLWILRLDAPISARPINNNNEHERPIDNVTELDVMVWFDEPLLRRNLRDLGIAVADDPDAAVYDSLFARRVRVTGWLTTANSPHAPARFIAERIEAAPAR